MPKDQEKHNSELIVGYHAVESRINHDNTGIAEVFLDSARRDQRIRNLISLLQKHKLPIKFSDRQILDELCGHDRHQGVVAVIGTGTNNPTTNLKQFLGQLCGDCSVLVLDHIQDPRNLGACIRTAECAGVDAIILPKDGASPVNDTVRKVASGAVDAITIITVPNLSRALADLKEAEFWVYGADDKGDVSLYDCEFSHRSVIVLGEEGKGLRRLTRQACDRIVGIPMHGSVSSLNVSVAAGVVLFEYVRSKSTQ